MCLQLNKSMRTNKCCKHHSQAHYGRRGLDLLQDCDDNDNFHYIWFTEKNPNVKNTERPWLCRTHTETQNLILEQQNLLKCILTEALTLIKF